MLQSREWRIMRADDCSAHLHDSVFRLCWSRGYVFIPHGGGVTPVVQGPDTDWNEHVRHRCTTSRGPDRSGGASTAAQPGRGDTWATPGRHLGDTWTVAEARASWVEWQASSDAWHSMAAAGREWAAHVERANTAGWQHVWARIR